MKILVVSTPIFAIGTNGGLQGYGGLEQVAWVSAKGLAEKGHTVGLIAPEGSSCPNVTTMTIGKPQTLDERAAYRLYVNEISKYDVVLDHTWQKWSYIGKAEGRYQTPILGIMHAPVNTMYQTLPPVEKPSIVCISQDQANHFEALHSRSAKVCYNGIDLDIYKPIPGMKRVHRYLFLARFSTIKGPDLAILACKHTGVGLDLIGDTSITQEPEYFQQCKAACDDKQIKMVGPCKRTEAVWWFSKSFAMLHPNMRFREPFGLAPVESMACGTPVIAWRYGAMKETIRHGETGFLVSSVEEMIEAIKTLENKSEHALNVMREASIAWASQFSIQHMVSRYEELCQQAIETGGW